MTNGPVIPMLGQKTETRKGGWFEDVWRIFTQTFMLVLFRLVIYASIFGELWLCARSVEWWMSLGMPNVLGEHDVMAWFVTIFYALLIGSGVFYAGVNILKWLDADIGRDALIIMTLVAVVVFALTAFALPGVDWLVWAARVDVAVFIGGIWTMAIVNSLPTGTYSVAQELLQQTRTNSEQVQVELVKQEERERLRDYDSDLAAALDQIDVLKAKIDEMQKRPPESIFVPMNHGTARRNNAMNLSSDEVLALTKFVHGWRERGTSRSAWTTEDGRAPFGGDGISDPQWRKFTALLQSLKILDSNNRPMQGVDTVINMLHLTPLPHENDQQGGGEVVLEGTAPRPTPPHPDKNGTVGG